ncbi:MAG: hypothetical protein QME74_03880 [Candidatus Edwardsbacteria bacterium]|nr:hypothetical protein [Candidatus Edwardsbacteria bacterium]
MRHIWLFIALVALFRPGVSLSASADTLTRVLTLNAYVLQPAGYDPEHTPPQPGDSLQAVGIAMEFHPIFEIVPDPGTEYTGAFLGVPFAYLDDGKSGWSAVFIGGTMSVFRDPAPDASHDFPAIATWVDGDVLLEGGVARLSVAPRRQPPVLGEVIVPTPC